MMMELRCSNSNESLMHPIISGYASFRYVACICMIVYIGMVCTVYVVGFNAVSLF